MSLNTSAYVRTRSLQGISAESDRLQKKLVLLWKIDRAINSDPQTIVVVPSMSIDALDSGAVIQAYRSVLFRYCFDCRGRA
jgi:hypothetical protein